jgi:protease-4
MSFGASYGWSRGDTDEFSRANTVGLGMLARPNPHISVGLSGLAATEGDSKQGIFGLGLRPLGTDRVTLFGDYALEQDQVLKDAPWSAGAALRVASGSYLTGRYFGDNEDHAFTVGLTFDIGRFGVASQGHYDGNRHRSYNTYRVRTGAYTPNVLDKVVAPRTKYVEFDLFGRVKYQRFRWFDDSATLVGLLSNIEAAKNDPRVGGIAINMAGMQIGREMAWEVREKLRDFKSAGKRVVIFTDGGGLDQYHFASVADRIVLDPLGILLFEGYVMGRTYLKGTLAKVGVAFDEWRFFTHKSAYEAFSRESMSEPDRQQRQRLVDEYYALAKSEICESRGLSAEQFDRLVNDEAILLPREALEKGLVDTLARWDAADDIVKALEGKSRRMVGPGSLAAGSPRKFYGASSGFVSEDAWGSLPQVAVIYAIGECAMDTGIKARTLSKDIEAATNDGDVEAVVFRVDSPGGDALASDVVAEALKKCREKKPVIVSQGAVAASGGYWVSMYGDQIVAAPQTITGSVGVIGGWFYNAGIKEKMGMSTDHVQAGSHADLGFGMTVPLIGAGVPDRNLTEWERATVERMIRTSYGDFVAKVAAGRGMEPEEVDKIGQGRVWPGIDGKANGLVDVIGGLETALDLAKERAGIAADQPVALVELPVPEAFDFGMLTPKLIGFRQLAYAWLFGSEETYSGSAAGALPAGLESGIDDALKYLRFRLEHNGEALPMLPLEDMDAVLDAQGR